MTSTQLVLFEEVHVKQVIGPPTISWVNDYNVLLPRNEKRKVDVGRGVYETDNQPMKATFKYRQEGRFCLRVANVERKEDGTITGKLCLVFDYTGKKTITIDSYKKEILN